MRTGRLCLFAAALFSFLGLRGFAESPMPNYPALTEVLSADLNSRGDLLVPGMPIKTNGRGADPVLLASPPRALKSTETKSTEQKPPLRIEILILLPWAKESQSTDPKILFERLALLSAQAGSLNGLDYWSASRKKMRLLYQKAHRIRNPEDTLPLPDPKSLEDLGQGPPWVLYALLEDLTFGSNIYRFSLSSYSGSGGLKVSIVNVNAVKYGFLPLAKPNDMASDISVIPSNQGIVVHVLTRLAAPELLAQRAFESAGNKALAVMGWFVKKMGGEGIGTAAMPHDIATIANF